MEIENSIKDAINAKTVALNYLTKEGILVWSSEIVTIFKGRMSWLVEIDGKTFKGVVLIDAKTSKVITANTL